MSSDGSDGCDGESEDDKSEPCQEVSPEAKGDEVREAEPTVKRPVKKSARVRSLESENDSKGSASPRGSEDGESRKSSKGAAMRSSLASAGSVKSGGSGSLTTQTSGKVGLAGGKQSTKQLAARKMSVMKVRAGTKDTAEDANEGEGKRGLKFQEPEPIVAARKEKKKGTVEFQSFRSLSEKIQNETADACARNLAWSDSPDDFVEELANLAVPCSYEEGQRLTVRGLSGEKLIVITSGLVGVHNIADDEVEVLGAKQYFGEVNVLGISSKWDATLIAKDQTQTSELSRESLLNVLFKWPEELRHYEELALHNKAASDHGTLQHCMELFKGLSQECILGIDASMMRKLFFADQTIISQNDTGDSMVILVRGQIDVVVGGKTVRQDWRGTCALLDDRRRSGKMRRKPVKAQGSTNDLAFFAKQRMTLQSQQTISLSANAASLADSDDDDDDDESKEDNESKEDEKSPEGPEPEADESDDADDDILKREAVEPVCFGELCLLGMQKTRTACIMAVSTCQVRMLHRNAFTMALEESHQCLDTQRMQDFLTARYKGTPYADKPPTISCLREIEIFQEVGCCDGFLDFLNNHLEDRFFLGGQKIIDENLADDRSMFILGKGLAKVTKEGKQVGSIQAGAVFGEMVLLGLATKRSSTIVATEVCYMQVLKQAHVVRAMQLYPDERQKVLMIALKKSSGTGGQCIMKADGTPDWKANSVKTVVAAVQQTAMFGQIGAAFIEDLSNAAEDRIYMPGELIIEEGAAGDSLFIMVSGQAKVMVRDDHAKRANDGNDSNQITVGMLKAGSISGELAMLGISKTRKATVEAETICVMWEVTHDRAMPVIEAHPDSRVQFLQSVCSHLEHTVASCIDGCPLFKNFSRKFRMLVGLYCDRAGYFPGQVIFKENTSGEGLVVLNYGEASLERQGMQIKTCAAGMHFNSTIMLGVHKVSFCTLTATQTSHVVVITRASYVQAIEQYPADQAAKDMLKQEQQQTEEFREAVRRQISRGGMWNKGQAAVADCFTKLTEKITDKEVLQKYFKHWRKRASTSSRHRATQRLRKQRNQEWVYKQREAVAHRQQGQRARSATKETREEVEIMNSAQDPLTSTGSVNAGFSPQAKATKYTKLSSLYLKDGQEWQSLMPLPISPRQARVLNQSGYLGTPSASMYSIPKSPRNGTRISPLPSLGTGFRMMEGSTLHSATACWNNGGDRRTEAFSWDATDALGL